MAVTERRNHKNLTLTAEDIYSILAEVKDPEIPVISIRDLGVLQQVHLHDNSVKIDIIPTYSGCPAMHAIKADIKSALSEHGLKNIEVKLVDNPIWTTDMISEEGKEAMRIYGIAPPLVGNEKVVQCPQCGSKKTTVISEFGSTACKALYRCENCLEPFDYFKCHA